MGDDKSFGKGGDDTGGKGQEISDEEWNRNKAAKEAGGGGGGKGEPSDGEDTAGVGEGGGKS